MSQLIPLSLYLPSFDAAGLTTFVPQSTFDAVEYRGSMIGESDLATPSIRFKPVRGKTKMAYRKFVQMTQIPYVETAVSANAQGFVASPKQAFVNSSRTEFSINPRSTKAQILDLMFLTISPYLERLKTVPDVNGVSNTIENLSVGQIIDMLIDGNRPY